MVQRHVDDHGGHGGEGQAVGEGELRRQEERRVLLVRRLVEVVVLVEDAADVVLGAGVVVRERALDGEEVGVPDTGEVDAHGDEDEEDDDPGDDVSDRVEGRDQRRRKESRYHGPVLDLELE